jgi:hypothetical protein
MQGETTAQENSVVSMVWNRNIILCVCRDKNTALCVLAYKRLRTKSWQFLVISGHFDQIFGRLIPDQTQYCRLHNLMELDA